MLALCDAATIGNPLEYEAAFKQRVCDAGSDALSLSLTNRRNVLTGALAMRRVIRDMEPDIIHVHTAQALLLLLFAGVRRPVVYTHHNIRCNFPLWLRSEEHTSELQSLMRISYAVFCLKKKKYNIQYSTT